MKFDPVQNIIELDGRKVYMNDLDHESKFKTHYWDLNSRKCVDGYQQIYEGKALYIEPKNKNLHKQIIVDDPERGNII